MNQKYKELLQKQHYEIIGNYSAVKICPWTKKSLRDQDRCYKEQFYGIRSHLCCQMSTTVGFCMNKCLFCWRPMEYTEGFEMKEEDCDDPVEIVELAKKAQKKLLSGFGGFKDTNMKKWKAASDPMHFAISLTGEPTAYPRLNELIRELHKRKKTTFVVSNGMLPDRIAAIEPPTQLYISIDAPNEELFEKIVNPGYEDSWQRLMKTLEIIKDLKEKGRTRTVLRFTLIKNYNMVNPEQWAGIIKKAEPMFVEAKAYMFVGFSRKRLKVEDMPRHEEVLRFAEEICRYSGYKVIDEKQNSRVVLLMKEDFPGRIMKF